MTLPGITLPNAVFWKDLGERALNTFWQGALPAFVGFQPTTDWSALKSVGVAAVIGGVGALLSALKSIAARHSGVKNSASLAKSV